MEVVFLFVITAFIVDDRSVRHRIACALNDKEKKKADLRWRKYRLYIAAVIAAALGVAIYGVIVANTRISVDGCGVIAGCMLGLLTSHLTLLKNNKQKK